MAGEFETVRSLMLDERFVALRRKADEGVLLWPDLKEEMLPEGYTREQTWELLALVRKQTAVPLPWDAFVKKEGIEKPWYCNTRALTESLAFVKSKMSDSAKLSEGIELHRGSSAIVSFLHEDLEAALEIDGVLPISFAGEAPTSEEASPRQDESESRPRPASGRDVIESLSDARVSTLLDNFYRLDSDLDKYAKSPLTPRVIEDLYFRLTHGVEGLHPQPMKKVVEVNPKTRYFDRDFTLNTICEIAEGSSVRNELSPVLRVINISWIMTSVRPMPCWNGLVEILVRHICLKRFGYQALSTVPLTRLIIDWVTGQDSSRRSFAEFMRDVEHYYNDYTPFFLLSLQMVVDSIARIETSVSLLERRDEELQRQLMDAHLNYRQRAIILNAINDPQTPQRIERHRRQYGVVYATARRDFLELVEKGYLTQTTSGRAFVYLAGPLISQMSAPAE
jgi:hypothetical protein